MDFVEELKKAFAIIRLDRSAMRNVAHNSPTWLAVIFFGIWSFVSGIFILDWMTAIGRFAGAIIVSFIVVVIYFVIAKIFNARGKFIGLYKALGYSELILGIGIILLLIPVIGQALAILIGIWSLIVLVVILESVYKMQRWKAVVTLLIPIVVGGILLVVIGAEFLAILARVQI